MSRKPSQAGKPSVSARAQDLLKVFEEHADGAEVLSLDCFDTLLWRRTDHPADVFFDLQHSAKFKQLGLNPRLRVRAEALARDLNRVRHRKGEVRLRDIYLSAFPNLDDADLKELANEELEAEKKACFGFEPVMDLVRHAKRKGWRVVIVSDTYLSRDQLTELLQATLPPDVAGAIDRVFCSSEFGRSKSEGLLSLALENLRLHPDRVLHVGDNHLADAAAASRAGMRSIQLVHQKPEVHQVLRLSANICKLLVPSVRQQRALPSPFHAVFANADQERPPAEMLGYFGVGPVLYAFARFVLDEVQELRDAGKRPRVLFLLRDGYLPHEAVKSLGNNEGRAVAISRFAAYAASFRHKSDIENYLAQSAGSGNFAAMARQLLLPEELQKSIVAKSKGGPANSEEFIRLVLRPKTVKLVVEASERYRRRLYRYLKDHAGVQAGETVVLVDLGYEGTAQRRLQPLLEQDLKVEVEGRYLLLARTPGWEASRKGLLDPSWCDDRTIATLVPYVALLEDVCTSDEGSVIDYDEQGEPVRAQRVLADDQYSLIKPIQQACLELCRDAARFFASTGPADSGALRVSAAGALGRLLFAPSEYEISCLEGFRLDMNMATVDSFALFDREAGLRGLRERGLFFMERDLGSLRMNYPIEVRSAGLELGITLLAQHRYGLNFTQNDLNLRREAIDVLVVRGAESTSATLEAAATHDGYYALLVPVGAGDLNVGILLGKRFSWFELDSVQLIRAGSLLSEWESQDTLDITGSIHFEGIERRTPRLCEAVDPNGFLFVRPQPLEASDQANRVCRVVFRPLQCRPTAALTAGAVASARAVPQG